MKTCKTRFKITKWIMFDLATLMNAFIVCYSCIPEDVTAKWNRSFTNVFANVINNVTEKKTEHIALNGISTRFSSKDVHQYNYLDGYELDEIPLGSAKQVECSFLPENATNKSIVYSCNPADLVQINQSGSTVSVIGMKTGEGVLKAKSTDGGFESNLNFKVVETVAPTNYEISLKTSEIAIGSTQTIDISIDAGVLGHSELVNFRYYDSRKLSYSSSNESIATVDEYGVIYPHSVGETIVSVCNGEYIKSLNVSVISGVVPSLYLNLSISGSNVCYSNDMLLNQINKEKYHYQLTPKNGETELNPEDFIWSSSNELLAKIDKHGVLRGFRKSSIEDELVTITAKSKITGQEISHEVIVKSQLPTELYFSFEVDGNTVWNQVSYTFTVGDNIKLDIAYNTFVQNKQVEVSTTDTSIIKVTNEGTIVTLHILKPGECAIKIVSVINPDLVREIKCKSLKAGAISKDNYLTFGKYVRKSIGHATVFMAAQIFTFLTLFMFSYEKKWWFYASISLAEGLFISALSELIQYFVPSRSGTILDVAINFIGVIIGAFIAFGIVYLINKKSKKKQAES